MDRTERGTLALLVGYACTFALAYWIDDPIVWVAWAAVTAVVSGIALIVANR